MHKISGVFIISAVVFLYACSGIKPGALTETFQGKQLVVDRAFNLPAGKYGITFQNGQPVKGMNLSVWELHCKLQFKDAPDQSTDIDSGRYLLTGLTTTDTQCTRDGCVKLNRFTLQTVEGPAASELRCGEQYSFDTPGTNPGPLTDQDLQVVLGSYLKLKPANN